MKSKLERVILSCKTSGQIASAKKYLHLWLMHFPKTENQRRIQLNLQLREYAIYHGNLRAYFKEVKQK